MDEVISVERVRHAVVVGRPGVDGDAVALAEVLPVERHRTAVVVGASALAAVRRLDPWVVADLEEATSGSLRVVAPGLGTTGPDGGLPPAMLLAERLGVEVVAPTGMVRALADGSLFAAGGGGAWLAYRPGARRGRRGPRQPAPSWQDLVPEPLPDHVVQIPLGLWVRRPGGVERPDDELWRRAADFDRMYVVLGAPGEQPPAMADVVEMVRALPDEGRDRAVLAGYGVSGLAEAVAGELGSPVRVAHGIPGPGGPEYVDDGVRWRPFAVESVYQPDGPPVLDRWVAPVASLSLAEPGSYRIATGWRADVVPSGLLIRPEDADPLWDGVTGPTADMIVADDMPDEVITALDAVVRALPEDARELLRVVPLSPVAAGAASRLEVAARVVPIPVRQHEPVPVPAVIAAEPPACAVVVSVDGRVFPAQPILQDDSVPATPSNLPAIVATTPVPRTSEVMPPAVPVPMPVPVPVALPPAGPPAAPLAVDRAGSVTGLLPRTGPPTATAEPPGKTVEVPASATSTAEQRQGMRGQLGGRYDVAARAVTRLLSERPGLRAGGGDPSMVLTELAVVRVFTENPVGPYDTDFHVCLAGGLRRLPTARDIVVVGLPADVSVRPQAVLRLPTPVVATPAATARLAGPAEALIWTTQGRRVDGMLDPGPDDAKVVLPGQTRLTVLAVDPGPVRRILLAEQGTGSDAVLDRLNAAAAARRARPGEVPAGPPPPIWFT
ncbi:MAG: hypothetical protein ABW215_09050 [Kibdelosporangium sp.]